MVALGIDFGTSNSSVAVYQFNKVEVIANDQGHRTTPSYVSFTDSEILTGEAAKSQLVVNPENTIYDANRFLGHRFGDPSVQEAANHVPFKVVEAAGAKPGIQVSYLDQSKLFSPEEICGIMLRKMRETAEAYVGKDVKEAVAAVPAYFDEDQREAFRTAGSLAGMKFLKVIDEPTAAALAYGLDKKSERTRNVLVYDLGGGTCDVTVLSVEDEKFQVKATAGDRRLGGEDFDARLVAYFVQEFQRKHKKDISGNSRSLRRLRTACELAKRTLSTCSQASVEIDSLFEGIDFFTNISRARLEELCGDLFRTTIDAVGKALSEAGLEKEEIQDIVLAGGSSRIPRIQKLLQDFFDGKELLKSINVDEVVSYGCSVQAAVLTGEAQSDEASSSNIVALSVGIGSGGGIMTPVIKRGATIPTKMSQIVTTSQNNQTVVALQVYEGERAMLEDNKLCGSVELTDIQPQLRGVPQIEVTFEIIVSGELVVTLTDKSTGKAQDARFELYRSSLGEVDVDVQNKVKDAEKHQEIDEAQREEATAKISLLSLCRNALYLLDDALFKRKLPEADCSLLADKCTAALEQIAGNSEIERDEIDEKQREIEDGIRALVQKAVDTNPEALNTVAPVFGGQKKGKVVG